MLKKSSGNMYPWPDLYTKNYIDGACPHNCTYCYVKKMLPDSPKYIGAPRLVGGELMEDLYKYGKGITIFVCHMCDLFAEEIPSVYISTILSHCSEYPLNTYLFQTKNPARFKPFPTQFPPNYILCTTLETNYDTPYVSKAPNPKDRYKAMLDYPYARKTITIEPILEFDLDELSNMIYEINPEFVSIGADSKNSNLHEPSTEEVQKLIYELSQFTEVKVKKNLRRIHKC